MTHLLPGGRVPRVHRARSPVPPRLPLLAAPRSVHHLAAVATGAYPPRRPPNAWSPGVPAPPGPCYLLFASGTPSGWRGGCLAVGLVRGAVRHYCLGGCSALVLCARRSGQARWGDGVGAELCVFPVSPFPPRVSRAVCGGPSCPGVPYPRSLVRHSMRSVRSTGSVRLTFWYSPRVLCVCVHSHSRGLRPPPPPPCAGVPCAPCVVPVLGAGRAVQRGPCTSACPASVLCSVWLALGGGRPGPVPPLPGLGLCAPLGAGPRVRGVPAPGGRRGGAACEPSLLEVRPGGPEGRGIALPRSDPLPSLGRQPSGCHWRPSGHGGRGPQTAPVRVRVLSPGVVCVASLCAGAGSLACRGCRGSRRLGAAGTCRTSSAVSPIPGAAALSGGGGTSPLPWGGWRAGVPAARGPEGGSGGRGEGGRAVAPHLPPSGGWPVAPGPDPPSSPAHPPQVHLFGRGRWAAPGAGRGLAGRRWVSLAGGGGGAACVPSSPEVRPGGPERWGVALPRSVSVPSLGRQQSGCHCRRSGHGGCGPHTAPVCVRVLSPGVVRAASLCAGAGSLARRGPRGSRRFGAWGRVAYALSQVPPPRRHGPLRGRGGVPSAFGGVEGWRPRGAQAGGVQWGQRGGGVAPWFPTSLLRGGGLWHPAQPPFFAGASPKVYLFGRGRWAAPGAGRGLAGRRWVSLAGGGGGGGGRCAVPPGGSAGGPRGAGGGKVSLPRSVSPPSSGGHQGGSLRLCPALHTALAHVRVPPP